MHGGYRLAAARKPGRPAGALNGRGTVLRLAMLVAVGLHGPAALGRSGAGESAEALFAELLDAVSVRPDSRPPGSSPPPGGDARRAVWSSGVYASLRAKFLALGPEAEEVVARNTQPDAPLLARVIAGGLAYDLSHREQLAPFYEQLGRVESGSRAFLGTPRRRREDYMMEMGMGFGEFNGDSLAPVRRAYDYELPADLAEFGFGCFWASWLRWTPAAAGIPAPLRIEQAAAWPDDRRLRALAGLKDHPLAFEVLQWVLLEEPDGREPVRRDSRQPAPAAILALAKVGGVRAIDVYRRYLELRPTAYVEEVIEALILIGDPRGAEVLEAIASPNTRSSSSSTFSSPTYRAAAADAQTLLPLLKDGPERFVELLAVESASLRLRAAVSLAARSDLRAVPVLFETAAASDPTARSSWRSWNMLTDHQRARDALISLGEPGLPALRQAAARSEAAHAALLAEVVALHVERPDLVERFHMAGLLRTPGMGMMTGPSLRDYRVIGWQVADVLGARATALLEAVIVWPPDPVQPRIAAFALARFRQERSIDVLVTHAATIDAHAFHRQTGSLAVAALDDFGENGKAAARQLAATLEPPTREPSRKRPGQ